MGEAVVAEEYSQVNGKAKNDGPFGCLVTLSDCRKCSVKLLVRKLRPRKIAHGSRVH